MPARRSVPIMPGAEPRGQVTLATVLVALCLPALAIDVVMLFQSRIAPTVQPEVTAANRPGAHRPVPGVPLH